MALKWKQRRLPENWHGNKAEKRNSPSFLALEGWGRGDRYLHELKLSIKHLHSHGMNTTPSLSLFLLKPPLFHQQRVFCGGLGRIAVFCCLHNLSSCTCFVHILERDREEEKETNALDALSSRCSILTFLPYFHLVQCFENQHPAWFQTRLQSGVVCTQANSVCFLFLSCAHVEANNRAPEQCGGDEDRSEWANCSKQNLSGSDVHRSPYSSFTSDSKSLAICFELFYSVYSFIFQVCHLFLAKLFDFTCYTLFTCNFFN